MVGVHASIGMMYARMTPVHVARVVQAFHGMNDDSDREHALLMHLAIACKYAGLLDAELSPLEMVTQARVLLHEITSRGMTLTLTRPDAT